MSYRERKGILLIADIGGYTEFLQHEELQHAQGILSRLLEAIVDAAPGLELVKFEGDATFFVAEDEPDIGATVIDAVRAMFAAFHGRQREVTGSVSCDCAGCNCACRLVLKFVAHHGPFGEHEIRGLREVIGPEVVLLHRLLKNTVVLREYALFTDALARKLSPHQIPFTEHSEHYDHIGVVNAAVWDLASLCEASH